MTISQDPSERFRWGFVGNEYNLNNMKVMVVAHPNSKKPRIETDMLGMLHVYVAAPPLEGRANIAVKESLADYFKVSKSRVILIKGEKSKSKTFEVG